MIREFYKFDDTMKTVYQKVSPLLVVGLILHGKSQQKPIYTLELIIKPGQDTNEIRERIMQVTGMTPGFYLHNTKIIVAHSLDLELLKHINDLEYVLEIKGSPYSAGGSTDF